MRIISNVTTAENASTRLNPMKPNPLQRIPNRRWPRLHSPNRTSISDGNAFQAIMFHGSDGDGEGKCDGGAAVVVVMDVRVEARRVVCWERNVSECVG